MRLRQTVKTSAIEIVYNKDAINDSRPLLIRLMYDSLKELPTYTTKMPDGSVNLQIDIVAIDINIVKEMLEQNDIVTIKKMLIGELT